MRWAWRVLSSVRTTLATLLVLALLLLANIVVPQTAVQGEAVTRALGESGPTARFLLHTLGFSHMPTSPVFLAALAAFFLNLVAVLADRTPSTLRRIRLNPPARATLDAWVERPTSLGGRASGALDRSGVGTVLRGFGYRPVSSGDGAVWGVKHRSAPLGFLIFHLSFFLICLGGAGLYYTRFVGTVVLVEGQEFDGEYASVARRPPAGGVPELRLVLESVEPRFRNGEPVHLGAVVRTGALTPGHRQALRVNHPARVGSTSILIKQAGLAPVLWLQDRDGFTLDRVAVVMAGGDASAAVPLAGGRVRATVSRAAGPGPLPAPEELTATAIEVALEEDGEPAMMQTLRPGERMMLRSGSLLFERLRYWAGLTVVSERGGAVLIAGFAVALVGLVWRLLLYRREVAVVWEGGEFRVAGRAEYYSNAFVGELEMVREYLQSTPRVGGSTS